MEERPQVSGAVSTLSQLSAWSLVVFGGLSLLLVCFSWNWAGALIGIALLGHGFVEARLRGRFLQNAEREMGKGLAWNQMALSASVLLYLAWQALAIDRAKLDAMFARDPLRSLLQQMPPEVADTFNRDFSKLLAGAYGIAGLLVLLGCLGMALMYLKAARR